MSLTPHNLGMFISMTTHHSARLDIFSRIRALDAEYEYLGEKLAELEDEEAELPPGNERILVLEYVERLLYRRMMVCRELATLWGKVGDQGTAEGWRRREDEVKLGWVEWLARLDRARVGVWE